jgi:hypothetical protein
MTREKIRIYIEKIGKRNPGLFSKPSMLSINQSARCVLQVIASYNYQENRRKHGV